LILLEVALRSSLILLALGLSLIFGCGLNSTPENSPANKPSGEKNPVGSSENTTSDSGEETPSKPSDDKPAKVGVKEPADSASPVTLIEDDGPLFQKYLEENKGKVILIDCWATWCAPCKEGFPATVALHNKHQADGLVVVSVSFDDRGEDDQEKKAEYESALGFLTKKKASFKNFLARTGLRSRASRLACRFSFRPFASLTDRAKIASTKRFCLRIWKSIFLNSLKNCLRNRHCDFRQRFYHLGKICLQF
jgi:thiol-disulfide isomerase/thioredoxin